MRPVPALAALLLVSIACTDDTSGPGDGVATALAIVQQPPGAAGSGVPLDPQPAVRLLNARGLPVAQSGVLVTAALAAGSGGLGGTVAVRTDAEGVATWTNLSITGATGSRTLRFEAAGLAGVAATPVQLGPGAAATLAPMAGLNQVAPAGTAPTVLPKVRVTDASDNPVPGASVTFEVSLGGGAVAGGIKTTGADGTASPDTWTLGPVVGANALQAYLTAAPGTVVTFTATGIVGPAAQLEIFEGDGQVATIGTAVAVAPAVKVLDAFGNAVPGVTVTFAAEAGSGTVAGATPVSNASGVARVTSWTIGFTPGAQSLTASRSGVPAITIGARGTSLVIAEFSAGGATTCAVLPGGSGRCWGSNAQGQFGDGTATPQPIPVTIAGGHTWAEVSVGSTHACGRDASGAAWCWGANGSGQLGDGTTTDRLFPTAVQGGHLFSQVVVSGAHTCGLRTDGVALCWGSNANGRLGDGTATARLVPTPVASGTWTALSTGNGSHTCGLQADQSLWCWGFNGNGRLGDGTTADRAVPTLVTDGHLWQRVAVGGAHTCAITVSGTPRCWGTNGNGQLGTGTSSDASIPVPVAQGHQFVALTSGSAHTCGLKADGAAWCWGAGGFGQLGNGVAIDRLDPVRVSGDFLWQALDAGGEHTCGRSTDGSALCFGRNQIGQLGDGTTTSRLTPVAVKPPTP